MTNPSPVDVEKGDDDQIHAIETTRRDDQPPEHRIAFTPDVREKIQRDDITTLPLSRTFSRNSYSAASEVNEARLKRVTAGKSVEPQAILPIGMIPLCHCSC